MAFTSVTGSSLDSTETPEYGQVTETPEAALNVVIKPWFTYIFAIDYIVIVCGVAGNILTIFAFLKYPALQTPTNYLICSQSWADALFLSCCQLFMWVNYTSVGLELVATSKYACLISLWAVLFSLLMSLTNLFLLSTERLVAIFWSLQYFAWVTEKSVKRVLAVCWVVTSFINILPILGWNTWHHGTVCVTMRVYPPVYTMFFYLLPSALLLILTTLINIIICTIAARKNKVGPVDQYQTNEGCLPSCFKPPTNMPTEEQLRGHRAGQYKITKMFLMVVGAFYLSLLPYLLCTILYILAPFPSWRQNGHPDWFLHIHDISKGMLGINGVLNPLIYASRNAKFRVAFMRIFGMDPSKTLSESS